MSVNIPEFWNLATESRLLSPEQRQAFEAEYGGVKGAAQTGNARTLAEWLIAREAISRYQSTILLAGRPGPFEYGEYKIDDRIERGRLAGLFRAVHAPTGHRVLLHYLSGPVLENATLWKQTAVRGDAHCKLVHPHLWRCYELADLVTYKFLVFEDLQGDLLADMVLQRGPLPAFEAARMVRQAAMALTAMHQAQLVHGDVSPLNLWMEPSGNVKLLRDPITGPTPLQLAHDPTGRTAVRADYAAPELMQPGRMPDVLTDVYGLGCTLYFLLTGRPPFPGGDATTKLQRHLTQSPEPIERFPGVPPQLASLVNLMLAKQPSQRVQQANIVAQGLVPLIDARAMTSAPVPLAATHGDFERAVQRKTAMLTAQATAAALASGAIAASMAAPAIDTGDLPTAPVGAVAISDPTDDPTKPPSERKREKNGIDRNLLIGLAVAGVMALGALIVYLNIPTPPPKENPPVAKNPETVTPSGDPEIVDPSGTNKKPSDPPEVTPPVLDPMTPTIGPVNLDPNPTGNRPIDPGIVPVKPGPGPKVRPPIGPRPVTPGPMNPNPPTDNAPPFVAVDDDGNLPWASPTWGKPVSLLHVPESPQIIMIVRPADLLASPEGAKVLKGLGPDFEAAREKWEKDAGIPLAEVEELIISLHDVPNQMPRAAFVIHAKETQDWPARWGNIAGAMQDDATVYRSNGWTRYVPAKGDGKVAVMGAEEEMRSSIGLKGAPPVNKEFSKLLRLTDHQRHFTVIFHPSYLITDGRELFSGPRQKLKEPLDWFLAIGDRTQATSFSAHFGPQTYLELRVIADLETKPVDLATQFRDRLKQIPDKVEDYIANLNAAPYWKKVALRYPSMIRALHQHTRVGAEDEMALVNVVLPGSAGHNLVAGSELVIDANPAGSGTAVDVKPMPAADTLDAKLAKKSEYSFPSQTLEFAMRDLGESSGIKITIIGPDLQLDGITRNQTIRDFNEKDKPVSEILTALVRRANPVTTVKDPSEKDQKLVWLIGADPENASQQIVLITTRTAAEKKGWKLPAAFVPKK